MCTASIIPLQSGGFRVVINRDELRSRPNALRPTALELENGVRAAWPTDAQAGGTWVAASDRGLVLTLLNGNPTPFPQLPPEEELVSRGLIVPSLIGSESAEQAATRISRLDLLHYAPFRFVAADSRVIADAVWDRSRLRVTRRAMRATCFVSSGLGDAQAGPRLGLFRRFMARQGASAAAQDSFHAHRWADRPEISVMMSRAEARTISVTAVEVSGVDGVVTMNYRDDAGESVVNLSGAATMDTLRAEWARGRVQC